MECWKYHAVFPHWWASLPSLLGNLTGAVLRCWGCKLHHLLQRIPTWAPGKDLHPAAFIIILSKATVVTPGASWKWLHAIRLPTATVNPHGCPVQQLQSQPPTDFPLTVPLTALGSTLSPALCTGKPGLGCGSRPPIYQLLMFQHEWFTVFPFPRSAIDHMTSRHEVFPLQEGFILQERCKMVKPFTGKYIVHFHRQRVWRAKRKGHCRTLACSSMKISRIQPFFPSSPWNKKTQGSGIISELWGKLGCKPFTQC